MMEILSNFIHIAKLNYGWYMNNLVVSFMVVYVFLNINNTLVRIFFPTT